MKHLITDVGHPDTLMAAAQSLRPEEFTDFWLAKQKCDDTCRSYASSLRAFAAFCGVALPTTAVSKLLKSDRSTAVAIVQSWVAHMLQIERKTTTVNTRLSSVRELVKDARRRGIIDFDMAIVRRIPYRRLRNTRGPTADQRRRILAMTAADHSPKGARDHAILRLITDLGLQTRVRYGTS